MYGTLVDPAAFADALAGVAERPDEIGAAWRRHQLEISWLLTLMERYAAWPEVTAFALDAALDEAGARVPGAGRAAILASAASPKLYADVPGALELLAAAGFPLAVLSNGTAAQLERILEETGIAGLFAEVVSVDEVRAYKPAPAVYRHAARRLGRAEDGVVLVSANPFDAAGAKTAGLRVVKVERGPSLRYGFAPPPDLCVTSLAELPERIGEALR